MNVGVTDPLEDSVRDLGDVPSIEVISRAAVMLLSASAERLGLADPDPDNSPRRDACTCNLSPARSAVPKHWKTSTVMVAWNSSRAVSP